MITDRPYFVAMQAIRNITAQYVVLVIPSAIPFSLHPLIRWRLITWSGQDSMDMHLITHLLQKDDSPDSLYCHYSVVYRTRLTALSSYDGSGERIL